jgi:Ca-activated chloride channel family protein
MRSKAPQSDASQLWEWPVTAVAGAFTQASADVRFSAAVAEYGMLLRHSKFKGNASFDHALRTAAAALGPDLEGHRTGFLDLVRTAARLSGQPLR